MKTFGLIANGAALENVTLTLASHDIDEKQTQEICARKNIDSPAHEQQVRDSVQLRNMRRRVAEQGAEEVRLFPKAS